MENRVLYKTRSLVQLCLLEAVLGGCAKRRTSIVNKRCWVCIQIINGLHTKNIHLPKSRDFSFLSFAQLIWKSKILIHRMNTENKSNKFQQNASNKRGINEGEEINQQQQHCNKRQVFTQLTFYQFSGHRCGTQYHVTGCAFQSIAHPSSEHWICLRSLSPNHVEQLYSDYRYKVWTSSEYGQRLLTCYRFCGPRCGRRFPENYSWGRDIARLDSGQWICPRNPSRAHVERPDIS